MPPDAAPQTELRRCWLRIVRIMRARPRLFAVLIGIVVAVALRGMPSLAERLLVSGTSPHCFI